MTSQESEPSTNREGTIMIVDDNPDSLRVLEEILHGHGYHVRPTHDGNFAIQSAQMLKPEMIQVSRGFVEEQMEGELMVERAPGTPWRIRFSTPNV